MRIRPAGHGDIAPITAIVNAAYSIYIPLIGKPPGPMLDDYAAHVRAHAVWVAEADAGIAGLIVLLLETDHLLLDNVAVDPARHGQGVGRALMRFAEVEARRARVLRITALYAREDDRERCLVCSLRLDGNRAGRTIAL